MLDRVREAMFSTLASTVPGARVLDLFSGTGSLGLEALSRGAASVHFFERDRKALRALGENVDALGVGEEVEVHSGDALDSALWPSEVDLVLLDPPYPMLRDPAGRRQLLDAVRLLMSERLAPGGVLVLHAHPRDLVEGDLAPYPARERTYGRTTLWYLEKD